MLHWDHFIPFLSISSSIAKLSEKSTSTPPTLPAIALRNNRYRTSIATYYSITAEMVSTMPPFFHTDPAFTFPSQPEEFLTQYYTAPYQSTTQPQYTAVEATSSAAPVMWNESTTMSGLAQDSFYQTSAPLQSLTSLPTSNATFWTSSLPQQDSSFLQTAPVFTFEPQPISNEFDFNNTSTPIPSTRHSRGLSSASIDSYASTTAPSPNPSESNFSRSSSPGSADLSAYGYLNHQGTWSCAYPGCTSRAVFTRGCDLRKHHKRHTKSFFCRYPGCTQATGGGFSSKKDLARHEAKHNPGVVCEWDGCDRIFSRVDNMVSPSFASFLRPIANDATIEGSLQTHTPKGCSKSICRTLPRSVPRSFALQLPVNMVIPFRRFSLLEST